MTSILDTTPHWPHVNEDDRDDLMAERRRLINCLTAIEEALREKHGFTTCSINPQTVRAGEWP
jgi:hypothetical protein